MKRGTVSVIIPCYNSEAFIEDALQSVIEQTWTNLEIIVVDDGSSDRSFELAKAFESDNRVRVYRQQNKGASAARNFGLKKASGEYIQFLDSDDTLNVKKIENQVIELQKYQERVIACCPYGFFTADPREAKFYPESVWKNAKPIDFLVNVCNGKGMMLVSSWLTPRALILEAGFWDERLTLHDDGEFFCRVLLKADFIVFCKYSIAYYRHHSGARISTTLNNRSAISFLNVCKSYQNHLLVEENTERTRHAVAYQYALFIYQCYDLFPHLCREAFIHLRNLDVKQLHFEGGKRFSQVSSVLGFQAAIQLRSLLRLVISAFHRSATR